MKSEDFYFFKFSIKHLNLTIYFINCYSSKLKIIYKGSD